MIRELKQTLIQEMSKVLDRLNNGYTIDFSGIVDKIYYINSISFNGMESPIINPIPEKTCTPEPPPIIEDPTPPGVVITTPVVSTVALTATSNTTITSGGTILSEGNSPIIAKGVCWVLNTNPTLVPTLSNDFTIDGSGTGNFLSIITNLTLGSSYHVRAYATNIKGTAYGEVLTISTLTNIELPVVSTSVGISTNSTIISGGNVISEGTYPVTSRGICINITPNPTIANLRTYNGSGLGIFSGTFTGLSAGTLYYIRAYAISNVGVTYGDLISIQTTADAATITTTIVTGLAPTSGGAVTTAISGGTVSSDGGSVVTSRGICWALTSNPTTNNYTTISGSGIGVFTSNMTELIPGTTYYVRAYATNSVGTTYGNQVSFVAYVYVPTVTTTAIANITQTTASSGGNITFNGGADITDRGVCWNITGNPTKLDTLTHDGTGIGPFTSAIGPLTENTKYYIRAYAANIGGYGYGSELSFTTAAILATLNTTPAYNITSTSLNTGGNIVFAGPGTITERGVCYSTYPTPLITDNIIAASVSNPFTVELTGLSADTPYYIRSYVIYNGSPVYGSEVIALTAASFVPVVPTPDIVVVANVDTTSITVSVGAVKYDGGAPIDEVGFVFKQGTDPTISDGKIVCASYNTPISNTFTGLTPGFTYYIKAYAHNSAGYGLGTTTIQAANTAVIHTIPSLVISQVSKTYNSITVKGTITNTGNDAVLAVSFARKLTSGVLSTDNPVTSNLIGTEFTSTYYSLTSDTDHYFKAFATNTNGTGESAELLIRTDAVYPNPVIITNTSYVATTTSLAIGLTITGVIPDLTVIPSQGFYWSTSPFTQADLGRPDIYSTSGLGMTTYTIPGLLVNTTYYVRAQMLITSPTHDFLLGQQIEATTLLTDPVAPINKLLSASVGTLASRIDYSIALSNSTSSPINFRLRIKNLTKGSSWIIGPQMIVTSGTINVIVSNTISSMGVTNAIGDSISIELSDTDGSTWTAVLTDTIVPFTIPYSTL